MRTMLDKAYAAAMYADPRLSIETKMAIGERLRHERFDNWINAGRPPVPNRNHWMQFEKGIGDACCGQCDECQR